MQGPGFFIIIAGNSAAGFAYKKKVLNHIVNENEGKSVTSLEDPKTEGVLLCQCIRVSTSIRETFRPGGMFKSIPVMGQGDLTIKWAATIRVRPTVIRIQPMRRKWASCSTTGWVSFSTRLLRQRRSFQDHVIVHDLLHLKYPNHGKLFKVMLKLHLRKTFE